MLDRPKGGPIAQIGEAILVAERTVKSYGPNLLSKRGMAHRSGAAGYSACLAERRRSRRPA